MQHSGVHTGTVMRWYDDKGFGFIKPHDTTILDDGSTDVFFHATQLADEEEERDYLDAGIVVEFTLDFDNERGRYEATQVALKVFSPDNPEDTSAGLY